jgi:gamma-glutamylcyclotransferase (GGCT)/AIG2-like uncharacterized protein YtfP
MEQPTQTVLGHRVFLYGTLKRGQPNHHFLDSHECQLIGTGRTSTTFPLVIATHWNLPFLLYSPGRGQVSRHLCAEERKPRHLN